MGSPGNRDPKSRIICTGQLLDRRVTSHAFYWHEIEVEIRERGICFIFSGSDDDSMDKFFDYIENKRRHEIYPHPECAEMCKTQVQ